MSLIKCPECNKEISDQSQQCIYCGYPLNNNTYTIKVDNISYDISKLKELYNNYTEQTKKDVYKQLDLSLKKWYRWGDKIGNLPYSKGGSLIQYVQNKFEWRIGNDKMHLVYKFLIECIDHNFEYFEFNTADYVKPTASQQPSPTQNVVRCPKCGSTSVAAEKRGFDPIWGFLGSDWVKYNVCQKCGHRWKIGR